MLDPNDSEEGSKHLVWSLGIRLLVENTVFFSCERFCRVLGLREAAVMGGSHHRALDPKLGNNNPKTSGAKNCAV